MSKALFITGTGTDIGKTYVTGLIVKKLAEEGKSAAYYKAAMSGNDRRADGSLIPGDALFVQKISGITQPLEEMCPYVYEHAYSPHLASRIEGHPVEMAVVRDGYRAVCDKYDYVTVEGSGGILCPICFDEARCGVGAWIFQYPDRRCRAWHDQQCCADGRVYEGTSFAVKGNHIQPLSSGGCDGGR